MILIKIILYRNWCFTQTCMCSLKISESGAQCDKPPIESPKHYWLMCFTILMDISRVQISSMECDTYQIVGRLLEQSNMIKV